MQACDELIDKSFLERASPDTVYAWLRESHVPYESRSAFYSGIPEVVEVALLERHDEIIDLGLSQWATQPKTLGALFTRHCAAQATPWPPQSDAFSYSILSAILSNASVRLSILEDHEIPFGIPKEVFDWIVENGDENLAGRMHSNSCVGLALIRKCCRREDIYERIADERWLRLLMSLSTSQRFKRPARKYSDSPDMFHWDIHGGIVDAVRISPKTLRASMVLWRVFNNIPEKAASDAHIRDEDLKTAVDSWNVEILDEEEFSHRKQDSLTPAERVQFNLLRLYCSTVHLNPEDDRRVYRLAAYSKNYLTGDRQLKVEDFQKYSDRDGPAFVYAASFNDNIWSNDNASVKMSLGKFPAPEDTEYLHYNRPSNKKTDNDDGGFPEEIEPTESEKEISALRSEISNLSANLSQEIGKAKTWMIWVALAAVVLMKW